MRFGEADGEGVFKGKRPSIRASTGVGQRARSQ
jgi:hypothetical protein